MKVSKDALQFVITSHIGIDAAIKKFIPPSRPISTNRVDSSNDGIDSKPPTRPISSERADQSDVVARKPTSSDVVDDDD